MPSTVSLLEDTTDWSGIERRKEPRSPASGLIELTFNDLNPVAIRGQLVDISPSGFQVSHLFASLRSGQEVLFCHAGGRGRARVMWTRVLPGAVNTGFLVLTSS